MVNDDHPILVTLPLQTAQLLLEMAEDTEQLSEAEVETVAAARKTINRAARKQHRRP
jgi:hypothetical protein